MNPKIQRTSPEPTCLHLPTPVDAGQVRHHQESTERQYALREKALELGWSESLIRTLDRDLGKTGTEMAGREDFKTLVADVSMGQVGAVFALEVSRLARSNLDWHRLLELCALTETLVIDEDGCYDPADFNDGLLLGLKGTMAQAELHFLHARLQGGKLNKAKKGELRFPVPVGFCYDEESRIILDPDEEVRGAVGLVFRLFRETGTAFAVMQRFAESALRFPKRSYGGAWDGKIIWGRLTHSRVLSMLKNPSYAGMYVFGRYRYRREISTEGAVHKRIHAVAMADWRVSLKEHHEGYITLEEFFKNQERLEKNRTNGEETLLAGPAREGLALLQGLLLCGTCGHALTVRYTGNGGIYPCYLCNRLRRDGLASKDCMSFRCDLLDAAIAEEVLKALQPAEIELALAALQELESRDRTISRQWQMRLERAEYEAALAERRYQEVDPSQRLVAGTLERRWNDALLQLEDLKKQAAEFQRQEARVTTDEQRPKSSLSPRICRDCGMRPPPRPKTANGCCGCSSRILRSRSRPIRSSFWFTSGGRVAPAVTFACSSRPIELTACGILPRLSIASGSRAKLARRRNRRLPQSRRACQRLGQTLHRFHDPVDPLSLPDS